MYAGHAMEKADRNTIFYHHHNPYTEGLLLSLPGYGEDRTRLVPIAGQPPSLITLPEGCPFRPRCPYAFDKCAEEPPLIEVRSPEHLSRCWLPTDPQERAAPRDEVVLSSAAGAAEK
jgi:oligopeptide/dipeptide ABC transporter ATP-binding protein